MDILKQYVDMFNEDDNELYKNSVDNAHAYEWLKEEIPLFSCPDKDLERTYYFRWWTYRKHIRRTEEGYVITEFLPDVPWAAEHNAIVAPFGHQLYEGRWLKNADTYLGDYVRFFLKHRKSAHSYSVWFSDAVSKLISVTGNKRLAEEVFDGLCEHYELWEKTQMLENGMFRSIDDRDAMEFSISGTNEKLRWMWGIRPTLNSYICADALAIAGLAELLGNNEAYELYMEKYAKLRELINKNLYRDGFYRAFHREDLNELNDSAFDDADRLPPRELLGYIPWMFNIPTEEQEEHFELLMSKESFYTDFGPATAERSHPRFLYEMTHDCLWNGYVWPFATSQTLYALCNAIDNYGCERYKKLYRDMLIQFAKSHNRVREDGKRICWIDESRHPFEDVWYTRDCLERGGWNGCAERGKDYNHSTFCDLVIGGIVGIKPTLDGGFEVKPNIPEEWDCFTLTNLHINGKCYDIGYTRQNGLSVTEK